MDRGLNRGRLALATLVTGIVFSMGCGPISEATTANITPQQETTEFAITEAGTTEIATEPTGPTAQAASDLAGLLGRRNALSSPAPWLVTLAFPRENSVTSLWAVRADQTEIREIAAEEVRSFAVQPQAADGSTQVAYITGSSARGGVLSDLVLKTVSLPGGAIKTITPLTSAETAYTGQNENTLPFADIATAIISAESMAWSPDGKWLAFVGAMDGPSADVYSYEVATGTIRQLTSGKDHAFQLFWSPDSRWIVHIASEGFARSGGVYEAATGIWAAAPDGSEVKTLEGPRPSDFLGWIDDDTLVVEAGPRAGPGGELREINMTTGEITELETSCYTQMAYDLQDRVYLLHVTADLCPDVAPEELGLFVVKDGARSPVPAPDLFDIQWSRVYNVFHASLMGTGGDEKIAISPAGEVLAGFMEKSPGVRIWGTADGSAVAWSNDETLMMAVGPDYQPISLGHAKLPFEGHMAWSQ